MSRKGVAGGTQVFPLRVLGLAAGAILLIWLLASSPSPSLSSVYYGDFYGIMIDAGSTGSRIHVYHFKSLDAENDAMELQSEVFQSIKPGLSSYADDPRAGAESLMPLLDIAMSTVPENKRAITPINLKATAGLRLLPQEKAQALLTEVESLIKSYPFLFDPEDAVEIMEGLNEGKFAWVTVNYLLNTIGQPSHRQCVVLDLGGGSTQIAMAVAHRDNKLISTNIMGTELSMYIYSHLGLGLMAGRGAMLGFGIPAGDARLDGAQKIWSPCVTTPVLYSYDGKTYKAEASKTVGAAACRQHARRVLISPGGSFASAPAQPQIENNQPIFAMSYYFDRAVDTGLIASDAERGLLTPADYERMANAACGETAERIMARFPAVDAKNAPFLCMDLNFIVALLEDGFGIKSNAKLTLAQKLPFRGEAIETQWPLGASLEELSEELERLGY